MPNNIFFKQPPLRPLKGEITIIIDGYEKLLFMLQEHISETFISERLFFFAIINVNVLLE